MKKSLRKLTAFTSAVAMIFGCSMQASAADYTAQQIGDQTYDQAIRMKDKTILSSGSMEHLDEGSELIVVGRDGSVDKISGGEITGVYSYISVSGETYNYIYTTASQYESPTMAPYTPFNDPLYRVSTEEKATIVQLGDSYVLMDNNGAYVSDSYKNIYWIGGGYYNTDNSSDNFFCADDPTGFTDNCTGLIRYDGKEIVKPTKGVIGYYLCSDGKHFAVDTEKGDYFIDLDGKITSGIYENICGEDLYWWNTQILTNYKNSKFARDYYLDISNGYMIYEDERNLFVNKNAEVLDELDFDNIYKVDYYDSNCEFREVVKDGKRGIINANGEMVVGYSDMLDYSQVYKADGTASYYFITFNGNELTLFDNTGKKLVTELVDGITSDDCDDLGLIYGRGFAQIKLSGNGQYKNYVGLKDNTLIDVSENSESYYETAVLGDYAVSYGEDSNCYFYDKNGKVVKKIKAWSNEQSCYYTANGKEYGLYYDRSTGTTTILDENLKTVWEDVDGWVASTVYNTLSCYDMNTNKYGIFSITKGLIKDYTLDYLQPYPGGYYTASDGEKTYIYSSEGKEIAAFAGVYQSVTITDSTYANTNSRITFNTPSIGVDNLASSYSFVYNLEKGDIEYEQRGKYSRVGQFFNGYATVYKYGKEYYGSGDDDWWFATYRGIVDINGNEVAPPIYGYYTNVDSTGVYIDGTPVRVNSLVNYDIPEAIKGKYVNVRKDGEFYIAEGQKGVGVLDLEGNEIIPAVYREVISFDESGLGKGCTDYMPALVKNDLLSGDYTSAFQKNDDGSYTVILKDNDLKLNVYKITKGVSKIKGDSNGDSEINMSDVVMTMQASLNPGKYGYEGTSPDRITYQGYLNSDVDGKEGVSLNDALIIQKVVLKIKTSF